LILVIKIAGGEDLGGGNIRIYDLVSPEIMIIFAEI
jgi:hypothetical protein